MIGDDNLLDEVPPDYRQRFTEIVERTDEFCDRHLNNDYKFICRKMAAGVCQEGSPVLRGKPASWACGVLYTVGRINFLTDPNNEPFMAAEEIAPGFGVSPATMYAKSRQIWDGLDLYPFEPDFMIPSMVERNPLAWVLEVNGIPVDIRHAPREFQVAAFEKGLIPYVPADREEES